MAVYLPVSVFLGDCGECQLELDGGELAEGSLASPAVVGVLDPHISGDSSDGYVSYIELEGDPALYIIHEMYY
jgi:hypothetical protein